MPLQPFAPNSGADKKIFLLKPRGFCAGVVRAIDVVKIALDLYGPPVYVRKEIVHNKHVVDELREAGAVFVEELHEVPSGARAIFSAHGVAPSVRREAKERKLDVIDATCPLVTKVHLEAVRFARDGYSIVLIGHKDHDEVIGTLGEVPDAQSPGGDRGRRGPPRSARSHARPLPDADHPEPGRNTSTSSSGSSSAFR